MMSPDVFLAIDGLEARYGRTIAVRHISFDVRRGETVCIVGPNGAGKSTILKTVAGGIRPASGKIEFKGRRIDGAAPEDIARAGLSFVPEGRHVFAGLTVEENLLIGTYMKRGRGGTPDLGRIYQHFPRLAERRASGWRQTVRRRAANVGHRPGVNGQGRNASDRRTVAWLGAEDCRSGLRHPAELAAGGTAYAASQRATAGSGPAGG
jgi:ABC-type branched-subunit amino acid transport system ATPase component